MQIKQQSGEEFMCRKARCARVSEFVCVLPVDEGEDRHQQVNGGIPLQRLDLLCQRNLEERKRTTEPRGETEGSH